jgi:polyhydroxyalkanoic acid synthase PhaR subunit
MQEKSKKIQVPNPFELWKEAFLMTENMMTASLKKSVGTKSFASGVEIVLNSYLQYYKMYSEWSEDLVKKLPFATREDVSRIAELVISLEDKFDHLETDFFEYVSKEEDSKQTLINSMKNTEQEIISKMGQQYTELQSRIENLTQGFEKLSVSLINEKPTDESICNINQFIERNEKVLSDLSKGLAKLEHLSVGIEAASKSENKSRRTRKTSDLESVLTESPDNNKQDLEKASEKLPEQPQKV